MDFTKDINFNVNNLIKNQSFKLTYNGPLAQYSEDVFIHFGFNSDWQNIGHMKMEKTENGFSIDIVPQDFSNFNFCFVDSYNNWDNNNGSNYSVEIHSQDEFVEMTFADTLPESSNVQEIQTPEIIEELNNKKIISKYKKIDFIRYFYSTKPTSSFENVQVTTDTNNESTLKTISNYKKIPSVRFFYKLNNVETKDVKTDTLFKDESIEISPIQDYTETAKVTDSISKSNYRKYDFTNSFEKYQIKNENNNLDINFKHNFNLSDSKKLCILGYCSFDNYTCEKAMSQKFVAHFSNVEVENNETIDNKFRILGAISNHSYTTQAIPQTVAPTQFSILGFTTLPNAYYTSANVFNKVIEIGTELPKEFDAFYEENNLFEATTSEIDVIANEIIDSIIEPALSETVEMIEETEDIVEDTLSDYTVDYDTFAEILDELILDNDSDAASIIETLALDSILDAEINTEEQEPNIASAYIEDINKILESVSSNYKEDTFDAFNNFDIEKTPSFNSFNELKTSEGLLNHVSHHESGERLKKERITDSMNSILDYLDSGIVSYTQTIEETTNEVSDSKEASISPAILDALADITEEGFEFDKSFIQNEETDIDMQEYSSIIQELEAEKEKLEMAFEEQSVEDEESIFTYTNKQKIEAEETEAFEETALTLQSDNSLSMPNFFSKLNVFKRKLKLSLYKVFKILPKMLKDKLFGYDD